MTNYTMIGRTYRYFQGDPLYPFGYGLSYTTFMYSDLKLTSNVIQVGQQIGVQVTVQNTGQVSADEVCFKFDIISRLLRVCVFVCFKSMLELHLLNFLESSNL